MKYIHSLILIAISFFSFSQSFIRTELSTPLITPWEITYGPDNFLWVTDSGGRVSRINPDNGSRLVVYEATDYFPGSPQEQLQLCFQPDIGSGTLGLTLHPDFMNPATSFIYFMYSYNNGTTGNPETRFKIRRLLWDASTLSVVGDTDVVTLISNGYDHWGGRLLSIMQNGIPYLFVSVGDHGISETNSPTCYSPQSNNPNNFAQDPSTDNGKIHRYNMDGSIPSDNPIAGNSFYTRGHRNPQGLMFNPVNDVLYDIEHGDRTDDEINILYKGMNYGWKWVRGYHGDNNFPGEASFISNYTPDPDIANDSLVEAFYSWCATTPDTSSNYLDWCTVAPSDGIYYGSNGIPGWNNSLLVVTLKNGLSTQQQLFRFQLQPNGELEPSTPGNPNPTAYFASDQIANGRLRDITYSPDGKKLFLINNAGDGTPSDKITVYTYDSVATAISEAQSGALTYYPNPVIDLLTLKSEIPVTYLRIYDVAGVEVYNKEGNNISEVDVAELAQGVYYFRAINAEGTEVIRNFVKN